MENNSDSKLSIGQRIWKWFVAAFFIIIVLGLIVECGDRTHRAASSFLHDSEKYD